MFRHFSFDPLSASACRLYEAERAAMNVSPTSASVYSSIRPRTPPCTVGDLAAILNQHSLRRDSRALSRPVDEPVSPQHSDPVRLTSSRVAASLLRSQRQAGSRMQCSALHLRHLSRLVTAVKDEEEEEAEEEEQEEESHSIMSRPASPSSAVSALSSSSIASSDDEAIDMSCNAPAESMSGLLLTSRWMSSQGNTTHPVRVARPVRMRKPCKHSFRITKRRSS